MWTRRGSAARRLELHAKLNVAVPKDLQEVLGTGGPRRSDVRFRLAVDDPNEPVRVTAPRGARPYAELPRG